MSLNTFADISSNNPLPDVAAYAAAGHRHIARKVTEGTGYRWFEGDTVVAQAHARGLRVGHYHWLRPDVDALNQAKFFVASMQGSFKPGDWAMCDFERTYDEHGNVVSDVSDAFRANQLRTFNAYVNSRLVSAPLLVYTGNWYLDGMPRSQAEVRRWPVVMSDYSNAVLPNPYGLRYVAWQFTESATVPGFSKPVDYNRWLVEPGQVAPTPVVPHASKEDEMLLISRESRGAYPVFVSGSAHTVIAHQSTVQALLAAGAKPVTVSDDDYARLRRGAVAK